MRRIVIAFLVAPAVVPLLFVAHAAMQRNEPETLLFGAVVALYTYAAAAIGGIPATFVYRHMGWTRAWQFALGGFALGAAGFVSAASTALLATAYYGSIGLVTAMTFWLIGVRGNPAFALPRADP